MTMIINRLKKMKKKIITKFEKLSQNLKPYIKMNQKIIKFDVTEIEEYEFYQYKNPVFISDIDVNKIVVSNKFPLSH